MRDTGIRLALAALLFAAWTGWLIYQTAQSADPVVVSRAQVLVAPIVIEADVGFGKGQGPAGLVEVRQVYRGRELLPNGNPPLKLTIASFNDNGRHRGWHGPDRYILCLELRPGPEGPGGFYLVPPPLSPGFSPKADDEASFPPIYRVTDSTRTQLAEALQARP